MEEIGNEMMIEEDIVVGTSHFDQQSFRMDLPEEESESDQDADETDQACNLGVVRKLLNIWLRGALKFRLPSSTVNRMSDCLTGLRSYIPLEFARKPRTLRDLDSIAILVNPTLSSLHWQYADTLLRMFVTHFGQLYGKEALVYNVHSLVHLAQDVRQHGCLDNISAFPYENHLQKLKKLQPSIRAILLCTSSTSTTLPSSDTLIFSTSTTRPSSDIVILYTSTTHPASAILMFSISTTLPFRAPLLFCTSS
ncbi:hypothetical protein N1851_013079 [Merluccius polli]|uniref:Uncharacterized protein n=1 Tax=Merluccius polli TaxID=89951 RepID=A0AA47MWG9_MERPO|nr:hypothetical protein N1851_013079 [Merluccius polli]